MNAVTPKAPATGFTIRNVSVLAYAQGFTLWLYQAPRQRLAEVMVPGFMSAATNMFNVGDMMLVTTSDGGTVVVVASAAGPIGANDAPVLLAPMVSATVPALAMAAE